MFKLPDDIMSRSRSTQAQYAIMGIIILSVGLYFTVAGVIFLTNAFGLTSFTLVESLWVFSGVLVVQLIKHAWSFKDAFRKGQALAEVENELDNIVSEAHKDFEADRGDGKTRRLVEIQYLGKSKWIGVEFPSMEGIKGSEADLVESILDQTFQDMMIDAERNEPAEPAEEQV